MEKVKVKDENDKPLVEVFSIEEITDKSKYFVDYDYSNVYFHIDVAGKLMKLDYYGIGSEYLSYTAVFTKLDKYGNVIETLADIIDGGKEIIETVKIFGGVTNVLQTLKTKITEGNQVIAKAQEKVNNLSSVVDKIDNMEIGGRNLWIDSKVSFTGGEIVDLGANHITGQTKAYKITNTKNGGVKFNIEPNYSSRLCRTLTLSAWIKYENVVQGANTWNVFKGTKLPI